MSNLDEADQKVLIQMMISDPTVFTQIRPILSPEYFDKKYERTIQYLLDFSNSYNSLPTIEQINNESRIEYKLIDGVKNNINVEKSVLDSLEAFCKQRALEIAIIKASERIAKGQTEGLDQLIKEAQFVSISKDLGINYWENPIQWLEKLDVEMGIIPTGWKQFDKLMNGGFSWGQLNYVASPSGGGKCEKRGTPILMYDGSIKKIEDIVVGDKLMGVDSKPRIVKYLSHGFGEMFDIHQRFGDDFTVTRNHTLSVMVKKNSGRKLLNPFDGKKYAEGEVFNITVDDYLKTSKTFKNRIACWKADIDWDEKPLSRKHMNSSPYYNHKQSSFTVTPSTETEYFGFELEESDQLYIHSDMTVTHNSLVQTNLALNWSLMGYNVIYFSLELDRELIGRRLVAMERQVPYRSISENRESLSNAIMQRAKDVKPGVLQIIDIPLGSSASYIESIIQDYEIKTNIIPQILIVDYAGIMRPSDKRVDINNIHLRDGAVSAELRELARDRTHHGKKTMVLTASQVTKEASAELEFEMSNVAGGSSLVHNCDNLFTVRTNEAMKQRGEYEFKMLKTRNAGCNGRKFKLKYNVDTLLISDFDEYNEAISPMENANIQMMSSANNILNQLKLMSNY